MMKTINTDRLLLRQFCDDDLQAYYDVLSKDEVSMWLGTGRKIELDGVKRGLEKHKVSMNTDLPVWAVDIKDTNLLIGHCGIQKLGEEIELFYALNPNAWGKGYATEASKAVISFVKENTKLSKLVALVYPNNKKSINVLEKLGFCYVENQTHFGIVLPYYELLL